jgi:hypothetical protein
MAAWSPTSFFNRRAYGPENLSPVPQKDFCNSIGTKRTWRDVRLESVMRTKADIGENNIAAGRVASARQES